MNKYELRNAKLNLEFHLTANFSGRETLKESLELALKIVTDKLNEKEQNGIYISNELACEAIDAFNDILFSHLDDDDEWYYKDKIKLVKQALGGNNNE